MILGNRKVETYVIVGKYLKGSKFTSQNRYINFNTAWALDSNSPVIKTAAGHTAYNQVYFTSEKQAQVFLDKFLEVRDATKYDFKIKKYTGKYRKFHIRGVKTIYGYGYEVYSPQTGTRYCCGTSII